MKIHNKRELQQIAVDDSADIDYRKFLKVCRNSTKKPYSKELLILHYLLTIL